MAFVPIGIEEYKRKHVEANPGDNAAEWSARQRNALKAFKAGERCDCGEPIWVIGSAVAGHMCFTCITGSANDSEDYEIVEACDKGR